MNNILMRLIYFYLPIKFTSFLTSLNTGWPTAGFNFFQKRAK